MGQAHKLPVIYVILTQTSDGYAHAVLVIHVHRYLRTVVFPEILDKLLRRTRQLRFLRESFEADQFFNELLLGRFLFKINE